MSIFLSRNALPPRAAARGIEAKPVHILVMGLTGAGKSTFISKATGDTSILINDGLEGGTTDIAAYILYLDDYEVHLIDTPGFDDPEKTDAEVLDGIATMINSTYRLQEPLAAVLYLHDVGRVRMMAGGERNIRLLEALLGKFNHANCVLVTTRWGTLADSKKEFANEQQLEYDERYWKALRSGDSKAGMVRFENTKESALAIIKPLLEKSFTPALSEQMVVHGGPNLPVGHTDAGQLVGDSGERRLRAAGREDEIERMRAILERRFDDERFGEFYREKLALRREKNMKRAGRWALRIMIVGGGLLGTVVTENPMLASSAFGMSAAVGRIPALSKERHAEKEERLKEKYGIVSFDTVRTDDM